MVEQPDHRPEDEVNTLLIGASGRTLPPAKQPLRHHLAEHRMEADTIAIATTNDAWTLRGQIAEQLTIGSMSDATAGSAGHPARRSDRDPELRPCELVRQVVWP
jgi:hypothetical protein